MSKTEKIAVVVGCNYTRSPIELYGCANDANKIASFLSGEGYSIDMLTCSEPPHHQPTRNNIINAIRSAGKNPNLKSFAFFFAGHGYQIPDTSGDEADGKDEVLVCQSSRGPSGHPTRGDYIVDDDLIKVLHGTFGHQDVNVLLMFDCCHSGTVCDFGYYLDRSGVWKRDPMGYINGSSDRWRVLCISAAQDYEPALEANGGGLMTNKFMSSIRKSKLLRNIYSEFARMTFQKPLVSAPFPVSLDTEVGGSVIRGEMQARSFNAHDHEKKGAKLNMLFGIAQLVKKHN